MMQLFVLYGAQDASLTLFITRGLAIITSKLPIHSKISKNLVWCQLFQKDILDHMQRPIISCTEIPLEKVLEVTSEDRKKILEHVKPAWKKYLHACTEFAKSRKGSPKRLAIFGLELQ